jgi:hypothetical protein
MSEDSAPKSYLRHVISIRLRVCAETRIFIGVGKFINEVFYSRSASS